MSPTPKPNADQPGTKSELPPPEGPIKPPDIPEIPESPVGESEERKTQRLIVGEAVKQATANLKRETDALQSQIAQGTPATAEQLAALKASADAIKATAATLPAVG